MIGKIKKGKTFLGVLRYLLSPKKQDLEDARIIAGTLANDSPARMATEFELNARQRPWLGKRVYHIILSCRPEEGLVISDAKWAEIVDEYARQMGFRDEQWVAVRHKHHVHIVVNRVRIDGGVINDSWDWWYSENAIRDIEGLFNLEQVARSHLTAPKRALWHVRARSQEEMALEKKGESSLRRELQKRLAEALRGPKTFTTLAQELHKRGVELRPNRSTEDLEGLSFFLRDQPQYEFAGSGLGRKFSWGNIKKRGVKYDNEKDRQAVERCLARCGKFRSGNAGNGAAPLEDYANQGFEETSLAVNGFDHGVPDAASLGEHATELRRDAAPQRSGDANQQRVSAITEQSRATADESGDFRQQAIDQIRAMGASAYVIKIKKSELDKGLVHVWTADEIIENLDWLREQNAKGRDILVRPADSDTSFLILEGVSAAGLDKLKNAGTTPAVVVEGEPNRFEATLNFGAEPLNTEDRQIVRDKLCGLSKADAKNSGFGIFGRLAGFWNNLSPTRDKDGKPPLIRLREATGLVIQKVKEVVAWARERARSAATPEPMPARVPTKPRPPADVQRSRPPPSPPEPPQKRQIENVPDSVPPPRPVGQKTRIVSTPPRRPRQDGGHER